MSEYFNFLEKPTADEIYLLAGWRQWADGGAVSSGLPRFLIEQTKARKIGELIPDGYYLFQVPGTQSFLRPIVRHNDGVSEGLQTMKNEFYYTESNGKGLVIFLGDEPHLDAERYSRAFLSAAKELKVKQIIQFGGVFAQVPYDRPRHIHGILSLPHLRETLNELAVMPSNYQGPSSIGSFVSKRAGEQEIESIGLYAFCPIFHFGGMEDSDKQILIENDYTAWLNILERVNHLLEVEIDLEELESLSEDMIHQIDDKVGTLNGKFPELRLEAFFHRMRDHFEEQAFSPLDDIWSDPLKRLGDEFFPGEDED